MDWTKVNFGKIAEEHEAVKGRPEIRDPLGQWLLKKRGSGRLIYDYERDKFWFNPHLGLPEMEEFLRIYPRFRNTVVVPSDMPVKNVVDYLIKYSGIANFTDEMKDVKIQGDFAVVQGGLADVYQATRQDGEVIAIKCIRQLNEKQVKHTARELSTWVRLKHDNILELYGLAMFRGALSMVSPWMADGNVNAALRSNPGLDRYQLCRQLAGVVKYLHDEHVVHGDIKGDNLLMGPDGTLKLTDFGLAIMHDKALQFSETDPGGGTTRWMAPELFLDGAQRCCETDVYAMGMTMLEMITGDVPFREIQSAGAVIILAVTRDKRTPDISELEKKPASPRSYIMIGILHRCWRHNPKERATATDVVGLLDLTGDV